MSGAVTIGTRILRNVLARNRALKRWIATEILWYRNIVSRRSAVQSVALLPISATRLWASSDKGARVSTTTGKKHVSSRERTVLGRLSRRRGRWSTLLFYPRKNLYGGLKINTRCESKYDSQSLQSAVGKLSCNKTALKCCMNTNICWHRKFNSEASSKMLVISLLRSLRGGRLLAKEIKYTECVCFYYYHYYYKCINRRSL